YVLWGIVVLLIVPFYMFTQKELAPTEDQSVVFGIIQAAPTATLDQTELFANQINKVYSSFPEPQNTFQITFPTAAFGGMVATPRDERHKKTTQRQVEAGARFSEIPGVRVISLVPPPLPGAGGFPVDFVIGPTAEPEQVSALANEI